ncbi:MAG: bifunctional acetate--CoA ligase family protein/GNAT family N-acetyltransferase [Hyphomonadaceae bacterium]
MTTQNFDALFRPNSIALVGASNRSGSVGNVLARNLFTAGFAGAIMPINPKESTIEGHACFQSVGTLPQAPDLAVIATPPGAVPGLINDLGERGCRAAVIVTAGFSTEARQQLLDASRPHTLRMLGPNCLGLLSPPSGINASFAHLNPNRGDIAFVSQSGAILTSVLDWAAPRGIGFSHLVSLGDAVDIDFGDMLDHLALDADTRAILLYVESITAARKFMSAARIAARAKPVILIKAGRSEAGASAALSHTGALAGSDAVYDAAFRRAGMLRVRELRELFDAAAALANGLHTRGDRLTILTNGGGLGVLAADALEERGGKLARLPEEARAALDAVLPATWSRANPIDIIGDASGARYRAALAIALPSPEHDAVLVMNCPTGVADNVEAAHATIDAHAHNNHVPLLACWMGEETAAPARTALTAAGIPAYETPDEAVTAFMRLVEFRKNQAALLEAPRAFPDHSAGAKSAARRIISDVLADGRGVLTEPEAKAIIAAYGIPTAVTRVAATPEQAGRLAEEIGGAVALKILSRDITHKSDVGGVALNLTGAAAVRATAEVMIKRVRRGRPDASIDGFTVQEMIVRPRAQELLLGVHEDAVFGPVIMFGQGGVAVEVIADRAIELPPLNSALAQSLIARTRIARLLQGFRDTPPADLDALIAAMLALSAMATDHPEVVGVDINPLLVDAAGIIAADARIIVTPATSTSNARFAIKPYPHELESELVLADQARLFLRPIRPEDEGALITLAERSAPEDLRLRFHGAVRALTHSLAARLSQIDYDREMALVARERSPEGPIAGVVRLVFDSAFRSAEYAVIVRSDFHHRGLGRRLLKTALDYARTRGAHVVWGEVLAENRSMLDLAARMGAAVTPAPGGGALRTLFDIQASASQG